MTILTSSLLYIHQCLHGQKDLIMTNRSTVWNTVFWYIYIDEQRQSLLLWEENGLWWSSFSILMNSLGCACGRCNCWMKIIFSFGNLQLTEFYNEPLTELCSRQQTVKIKLVPNQNKEELFKSTTGSSVYMSHSCISNHTIHVWGIVFCKMLLSVLG